MSSALIRLEVLCSDRIIQLILNHVEGVRRSGVVKDWLMPVTDWVRIFGLKELGDWINQLPGCKAQEVLIRAIGRPDVR